MIFERDAGRYRMSMDRREALGLIADLAKSIKDGIGAFPVTTISVPLIEKDGKNGYSRVLLMTVDPKLYAGTDPVPLPRGGPLKAPRQVTVRRGVPRRIPEPKARPK